MKKLPTIQFRVGSDTLNVIKGGKDKPSFVFIHGKARDVQNAEYWAPQLTWLNKKGLYYFVDMLGHGQSVPGPSDGPAVSLEKQVDAISSFLESEHVEKPVFLVGRSYGGKVALEVAKKTPNSIKSLIFIAPAISVADAQTLPDQLKSRPMLFVSAEDDPVIGHDKVKEVAKSLPLGRFYNAGKILVDENVEKWKAHCPEMVNPEQFGYEVQEIVEEFMF